MRVRVDKATGKCETPGVSFAGAMTVQAYSADDKLLAVKVAHGTYFGGNFQGRYPSPAQFIVFHVTAASDNGSVLTIETREVLGALAWPVRSVGVQLTAKGL